MKYSKLTGIILNRHSVREADRFYTILTRDEGKLEVYAAGVRSLKSKRSASLDLLSLINFELVARGERRTLTHVELVQGFRAGKRALKDISRLFVLAELVDSLVPENDPHEEVYDLLETALTHLHRFDTPDYLTRFKRKLLILLGYGEPEGDLDTYIESLLSRPLRSSLIDKLTLS